MTSVTQRTLVFGGADSADDKAVEVMVLRRFGIFLVAAVALVSCGEGTETSQESGAPPQSTTTADAAPSEDASEPVASTPDPLIALADALETKAYYTYVGPFSSAIVPNLDRSGVLYATTADGGVHIIEKLLDGSTRQVAADSFAPVVSPDGRLAMARVEAGAAPGPGTALVVRASDGTETVREPGSDGVMTLPLAWMGDTILVQEVDVEAGQWAFDLVTPDQSSGPIGMPLAVSPARDLILVTNADVTADAIYRLIDTRTLEVVDAITRSDYASAYLTAEQIDRWNSTAPIDGEHPLPIAPTGPGIWVGELITLPASGGIMTMQVTGDELTTGSFMPLVHDDDGLAVQTGRIWPGTGFQSYIFAVIIDLEAAQPSPPPTNLDPEKAEEAASETAEQYRDASQDAVFLCESGSCSQASSYPPPPLTIW